MFLVEMAWLPVFELNQSLIGASFTLMFCLFFVLVMLYATDSLCLPSALCSSLLLSSEIYISYLPHPLISILFAVSSADANQFYRDLFVSASRIVYF